jgi:NTF2-like protein (DUF6841)
VLNDDAIEGAMDVTDRFLATFNNGDAPAHAATLAYPHVRLASGTVRIWNDIDEAATAMTRAIAALRGSAQWHHSEWDHRHVIHFHTTKVHLDVQFTRYREDESVIGIYPAVYVIVQHDGQWLIQCRSSFAP